MANNNKISTVLSTANANVQRMHSVQGGCVLRCHSLYRPLYVIAYAHKNMKICWLMPIAQSITKNVSQLTHTFF